MSQNTIVMSNNEVLTDANYIQGVLLNPYSYIGLYQSSLNPDPSTPLSSFTAVECNFDTYGQIYIGGQWNPPTLVATGEADFTLNGQTWLQPLVVGNTIWGWFITDYAGNLALSYELSSPINFIPGGGNLLVNVTVQVFARSILP
jgi:hypothetical protein